MRRCAVGEQHGSCAVRDAERCRGILGVGGLARNEVRDSFADLWVPKTHPPRSCNHAVFVDEAAQDVGSLEGARCRPHRSEPEWCRRWTVPAGRGTGAVPVLVLDVLAEFGFEVTSSEARSRRPSDGLVGHMRAVIRVCGV